MLKRLEQVGLIERVHLFVELWLLIPNNQVSQLLGQAYVKNLAQRLNPAGPFLGFFLIRPQILVSVTNKDGCLNNLQKLYATEMVEQ